MNVSYILHKPFDLAVSGDLAGIGTVEEEHGVALGPASHPPTGGLELGKQNLTGRAKPVLDNGVTLVRYEARTSVHGWFQRGQDSSMAKSRQLETKPRRMPYFPSVAKDDAGRPTNGHRLVCLRELQVPCVSHMAFLPLPCLTLRRPVGECFFPLRSTEYRRCGTR